MDRELRRSLLILAAVTIVTAWFSNTFYFPDEHYQVLEFMGLKLGITPASELPWEFAARIRPWFQPLVYFLIASAAARAGHDGHVHHRLCAAAADGPVLAGGAGGLCPRDPADHRGPGREAAPLSAICRCSAFCPICSCAPRRRHFRRLFLRWAWPRRWAQRPSRVWRWRGCCAAWRLNPAIRPA